MLGPRQNTIDKIAFLRYNIYGNNSKLCIKACISQICCSEDVVTVKSLPVFLCIALVVFTAFSLRADIDENDLYESSDRFSTRNSRFPIDFGWIVDLYEFVWIEAYIDEYYGIYYKHWERYLASKQREIAGKFGLSNIHFRPNLKRYEDTELVLSKSIWKDRLLLRYLAPIGDMGDLRLLVALKPHRLVTFVADGHRNGERSIAILVERPLGSKSREANAQRRAKRLLYRAKKLAKCE